jgi:hypothetical protein
MTVQTRAVSHEREPRACFSESICFVVAIARRAVYFMLSSSCCHPERSEGPAVQPFIHLYPVILSVATDLLFTPTTYCILPTLNRHPKTLVKYFLLRPS